MKIEKDKEVISENEPKFEKSFHHLFKTIAKDLKAASKAHTPTLLDRVTHKNKIDK